MPSIAVCAGCRSFDALHDNNPCALVRTKRWPIDPDRDHLRGVIAGVTDKATLSPSRRHEDLCLAAARATESRREFDAMDFAFLLDPHRGLLSVGYQVADGKLDESCYDLLASECRLASYTAIAKGDIATRHWVRLGRPVTAAGGGAALLSWSGSMFEYLMPSLVMRTPSTSLLSSTTRRIVRKQIE